MSDKFNIVDYYNTIIRFIRKMLNWNNFYKKLTKVNFEVLLTGLKTKKMNTWTKGLCHTLDDPYSSNNPRGYQAQRNQPIQP